LFDVELDCLTLEFGEKENGRAVLDGDGRVGAVLMVLFSAFLAFFRIHL